MNALAGIELVGHPAGGWTVGGFCWLVLRLLGRMDVIERQTAQTLAKVDEIHSKITARN